MSDQNDKYIQNLVEHLLNKNRFREEEKRFRLYDDFINSIRVQLLYGDLAQMKAETLGRIMGSLKIGDVLATKEEILKPVTYSCDCKEMLREIVASCLAIKIGHALLFDK